MIKHLTSRYSYASLVHTPTSQPSTSFNGIPVTTKDVSQIHETLAADDVVNSLRHFSLHHHHNVCPAVSLSLSQRDGSLRVLHQVVMK